MSQQSATPATDNTPQMQSLLTSAVSRKLEKARSAPWPLPAAHAGAEEARGMDNRAAWRPLTHRVLLLLMGATSTGGVCAQQDAAASLKCSHLCRCTYDRCRREAPDLYEHDTLAPWTSTRTLRPSFRRAVHQGWPCMPLLAMLFRRICDQDRQNIALRETCLLLGTA